MKLRNKVVSYLESLLNKANAEINGTNLKSNAETSELIATLLEKPKNQDMGDFALPCFRLAGPLKSNPKDLSEAMANLSKKEAQAPDFIESIDAAGPFLNIKLRYTADIAAEINAIALHRAIGKPEVRSPRQEKVMIEFSQPNTHKPLHVGHVRNICLGDALVRIMKYLQRDVVPANYIGDEGTHIAKCLLGIELTGSHCEENRNKNDYLGENYAAFDKMFAEADENQKQAYKDKLSVILGQIEKKSGPYYDQWADTRQWSLDDFDSIYKNLGVHFDVVFYESQFTESCQGIVDEFLARGVFVESEGAIGIDLKNEKLGFLILRKTDGNSLYATKDLVLQRIKFENYGIKENIVVVADEQNHHFRQVFKTLEKMGFEQAKHCFHLKYGMVVGKEGKMSSRKGNTITYYGLVEKMREKVKEKMLSYASDWTDEELAETSQRIVFGAIKYGMLSQDPVQKIVFDIDDWLSFEGNTGPYLMYAYARALKILAKSDLEISTLQLEKAWEASLDAEKDLIRLLIDFNDEALAIEKSFRVNTFANYLYDLAKAFNKFYINAPILKVGVSDDIKLNRLVIVNAFVKTMGLGLDLLGITPAEKM